jgi:hypothetical protein
MIQGGTNDRDILKKFQGQGPSVGSCGGKDKGAFRQLLSNCIPDRPRGSHFSKRGGMDPKAGDISGRLIKTW